MKLLEPYPEILGALAQNSGSAFLSCLELFLEALQILLYRPCSLSSLNCSLNFSWNTLHNFSKLFHEIIETLFWLPWFLVQFTILFWCSRILPLSCRNFLQNYRNTFSKFWEIFVLRKPLHWGSGSSSLKLSELFPEILGILPESAWSFSVKLMELFSFLSRFLEFSKLFSEFLGSSWNTSPNHPKLSP